MALTQIEILKKYKIPIEGKSGQHLLIDSNIQSKIIDLLELEKNMPVIEIGPGLGALTQEMLARGFQVTAIEKDTKFVEILKDHFAKEMETGQLKILNQDVLEVDFAELGKSTPAVKRIVSNLPYYITAPILIKTFEAVSVFDRAVYMMQKEVAERVVASAGSSDYGRLSLNTFFSSESEINFNVSPKCFTPQPKVWSSVLTFNLKDRLKDSGLDRPFLLKLIKVAFSQRRKMLISIFSKSQLFGFTREQWEYLFKDCDLSVKCRAEEVSPEKFILMGLKIKQNQVKKPS